MAWIKLARNKKQSYDLELQRGEKPFFQKGDWEFYLKKQELKLKKKWRYTFTVRKEKTHLYETNGKSKNSKLVYKKHEITFDC